MKKVWDLRKAGLGVLSNMPGDAKPVPVIEDTAVNPQVLPQYIEEFNLILKKLKLSCVYHAHISTGEIHLRPVLNPEEPCRCGAVSYHRPRNREAGKAISWHAEWRAWRRPFAR